MYTNVPFIYPYMYTHPHPILTLQQASGLFSSLMQKKKEKDFGPCVIKELRLQMVHALQSIPFVLFKLLILDLLLEARIEEIRFFNSYAKGT